MKWMTKTQRETFLALVALSPGGTRPWVTAEQVLEKRLNGEEISNRQRGAKMDWVKTFLRRWSVPGSFLETRLGKTNRVWRLTKKGKHLAKTGETI